MTAHREETKYLVSPEQARLFAREVRTKVATHRHRGEGANLLPQPRHYVTTIYFDTPDRALYRAAHATESHLKLRAKEYYDVHPDLTETATDPRQLVRFQSILWLELKSRDAKFSGKQRIGLPKADVPAFFTRGQITQEMVQIQQATHGEDARAVLDSVAQLCRRLAEPVRADCLVNYRRVAWQDDAGELRITLDTDLAFYAPPDDLWTRAWALLRNTLGPAVASESRRVIEIKTRAAQPGWLVEALHAIRILETPFSKFDAASSAVHG